MKKFVLLVVLVFSMSTSVMADDFGHEGFDADDPTIEEMLVFALEDEVLAYSTYEKIVEEFDVNKPFTNIMKAELKHQEAIIDLMEAYDIEIPQVDPSDYISLPVSLEAAYKAGVQAEIDNIALYQAFVEKDIPEDVRQVFEYLIKGSEKHQAAFERQENRNTGFGGRRRQE